MESYTTLKRRFVQELKQVMDTWYKEFTELTDDIVFPQSFPIPIKIEAIPTSTQIENHGASLKRLHRLQTEHKENNCNHNQLLRQSHG